MTSSEEPQAAQLAALLGDEYLHSAPPERLGQVAQVISEASTLGRDADGPVREVCARLGDRWSCLLLQLAQFGPLRFSVLQRLVCHIDSTGISRRMLALKLRALERDGFVRRQVSAGLPPRVEYSLTPLGEALRTTFAPLLAWLGGHRAAIEQARRDFEQDQGRRGPGRLLGLQGLQGRRARRAPDR